MLKKKFTMPITEIINFKVNNIIETSLVNSGIGGNPNEDPNGERFKWGL